MEDIFALLKPGTDLVKDKYLHAIYDDYEGLRVLLKGLKEDDKILQIKFKSYLSYRSTNESFRLKTLYEDKFENGLNFSRDTKYIRWVKEESSGIYDDQPMIHYLICSNDDITDVISFDEPIVAWL